LLLTYPTPILIAQYNIYDLTGRNQLPDIDGAGFVGRSIKEGVGKHSGYNLGGMVQIPENVLTPVGTIFHHWYAGNAGIHISCPAAGVHHIFESCKNTALTDIHRINDASKIT